MKNVPFRKLGNLEGPRLQERVADGTESANDAPNIEDGNSFSSHSSSLEITDSTRHPLLQHSTIIHTASEASSGHELLRNSLETIGSSKSLQTSITQTELPPLISWKHALLPVHPSVKQFDPPVAHTTLHLKKTFGSQSTASLLVVEEGVPKPLSDPIPKLLETPSKSPTLSLQSPQSSAANSSSISSNSSNTTSSPTTPSPEHPGSWRRSTLYEPSPAHPKRFTPSRSRNTAPPLSPRFAKSWRRSVTEQYWKESHPVKESKIRTARPSRLTREQIDHPLRRPSLEVRKGVTKLKLNSILTGPLPEELNCAVYITNIPNEVSPSEVFDYVHTGTVQALQMYPANDRNAYQAAKVVFAKAESAANLIDQAKGPYHVYMGDVRLHVAYNRDGCRAYDGLETRVLIIEGPEDLMTFEHWKDDFDKTCFYLLDRWSYRPCAHVGRVKMEFRFLSAAMAKACFEDIESEYREEGEDGVLVAYGRDVCDADYLEPWAAPK